MEISSEMYGCFLSLIIMRELPEKFRILIPRNLEKETWNLTEFHKEFQLREQCLVNSREVSHFILLQLCTLTVLRTNDFLVCGAFDVPCS